MTYDIRAVQARLNLLGFGPLVVDGIFGPRTTAALTAFKRSVGLAARDYLGPVTWAALMGGPGRGPEGVTEGATPWLEEAIRVKGLHEARDTSALSRFLSTGVASIDPRSVPWCGAFTATCLRKWRADIALPANPLAARSWAGFGMPVPPQLGAVMVFWRGSRTGWQGHVAFYWGEDADAWHVIGGNQSDAVTVTRIGRDRLLSSRWPLNHPAPGTVIRLTHGGAPLSQNEA